MKKVTFLAESDVTLWVFGVTRSYFACQQPGPYTLRKNKNFVPQKKFSMRKKIFSKKSLDIFRKSHNFGESEFFLENLKISKNFERFFGKYFFSSSKKKFSEKFLFFLKVYDSCCQHALCELVTPKTHKVTSDSARKVVHFHERHYRLSHSQWVVSPSVWGGWHKNMCQSQIQFSLGGSGGAATGLTAENSLLASPRGILLTNFRKSFFFDEEKIFSLEHF